MITSLFKELKGLLLEEDLKVNPVKNYSFLKNAIIINLANNEIEIAAMDYPVMFVKSSESFLPIALMGFQEKNFFVNANGSWVKEKYIPSFFRVYPFALVKGTENNHTIVYDNSYSGINKPKGTDIVKDGAFTDEGQKAIDFMTSQYKSLEESKKICTLLEELGLLKEIELTSHVEGKEHKTRGMYQIDTAAVNSLDDEKLLKLVKSGAFRVIDAHLLSLHNLRKLK